MFALNSDQSIPFYDQPSAHAHLVPLPASVWGGNVGPPNHQFWVVAAAA